MNTSFGQFVKMFNIAAHGHVGHVCGRGLVYGRFVACAMALASLCLSSPGFAKSFGLDTGSVTTYGLPDYSPDVSKSGGIGGTGSGNSDKALPRSVSLDSSYSFSANDSKVFRSSRDGLRSVTPEQYTELQFRLSPGKFDFSLAGGFGLGAVFANPEFELRSRRADRYELEDPLPELHNGLSYSAGVNIEHENAHISDTAYVSSGQLGVSYGRMGRVWYSGVDVSIQQSTINGPESLKNEVVSFDLTTGVRLGWTGMGAEDPLWLLSLRGDFDLQDDSSQFLGEQSSVGEWYLNPSLFWDRRGFRFAAQLEVPIGQDTLRDFEEPSYKIRAILEKSFR